MGTLFYVKDLGATLTPGQQILRAADHAIVVEANTVLARARADAAAILHDAHKVYAAEKARGHAEGLEQGKAEMTERMLLSVVSSVDYLEKMEGMMVEVVMSTLQKIFDGVDHRELAVGLVRRALVYVRGQKKVILRICPDDLEAVQEALEHMLDDNAAIGILEVAADTRLERGACLLESDVGLIDASLSTQLENIRSAFLHHLGGGAVRL